MRYGEYEQKDKIQQGVRQGCSLSPVLLNTYIQTALEETRDNVNEIREIEVQGGEIDIFITRK